jgi:hypothetical protein
VEEGESRHERRCGAAIQIVFEGNPNCRGQASGVIPSTRSKRAARSPAFASGSGDEVAHLLVAEFFPDAVAVVAGIALDGELRGQQFLAARFDLVMNVRRAPGVGHGFDGAEERLTTAAGDEAPKPWKFASGLAVGPPDLLWMYTPLASHCQISTVALRTGSPLGFRMRPLTYR